MAVRVCGTLVLGLLLFQLCWITSYQQLEKTCGARIVEHKSVIRVLECPLHFLDIVRTAPYVDFWVLRVLHAKSEA